MSVHENCFDNTFVGPTYAPYIEPYIPAAPWCSLTSGGKECRNYTSTECSPLEGAEDDGLCLCRSGFTNLYPENPCESKWSHFANIVGPYYSGLFWPILDQHCQIVQLSRTVLKCDIHGLIVL